jgi:hypothetical protein
MSPFRWLEDLKKSGYLDAIDKRRFQGNLQVVGNDNKKTFTVGLSWTDKMNQSGEIFIPSEGVKRIHRKILELEQKGFREELGHQIYPP